MPSRHNESTSSFRSAGSKRSLSRSSMNKSTSLPNLKRRSPFSEAQGLVTVEVSARSVMRNVVKKGAIKSLPESRLPFAAFERGVEWERPHVMAKPLPAKLPPLKKVLRAIREMGLDVQASMEHKNSQKLHNPAFGGSPPYKGGPRLPLRRGKEELRALAIQRSNLSGGSAPMSPVSPRKAKVGGEETREYEVDEESESQENSSSSSSSLGSDSESELEDFAPQRTVSRRRLSAAEAASMRMSPENDDEDDESDMQFPWTEDELRSVFGKFDTDCDGEVATEELIGMLRYMGCMVVEGQTDAFIKEMFKYATVSWEEFLEFLRKFRERDLERLREEFKEADSDGSGELDFDELHALLIKMGYSATEDTTMEAMEALGCAERGLVKFRQFENLREHLRLTEGVSKVEVAELRLLYDRASQTAKVQNRVKHSEEHEHSAVPEEVEMPAEDVWRLTSYMNYSADKPTVERLCAEVDADGSGFVSFQELLKLVRRVRDLENEAISKVFKHHSQDGQSLHLQKLPQALIELMYYASQDLVVHILEQMGDLVNEDHFTKEEFAKFLRFIRQSEGFTPNELAELKEAFEKQCKVEAARASVKQEEDEPITPKTRSKSSKEPGASEDDDGPALDALSTTRVLRWFGFGKPLQEVSGMLDVIDLDGSGELEFNEFTKLMARLFKDEAMRRTKIFNALDRERSGKVGVGRLESAIKMLNGAAPSPGLAEEAATMTGFSLADKTRPVTRLGFEEFFKHYRTVAVEEIRRNACYSLREVAALRNKFDFYDTDRSNTVERKELQKIITDYFPEATKSKEAQREVQLAIRDVDVNNDGKLDFLEFLALMRRCDDSRDESDIKQEKLVVKELGFTEDEVEGYRQIFLAHANLVGELTLDLIIAILGRVIDFSPQEAEELPGIVREVHPENREAARFPHFLRLIKRLTDDNYGRVNQASSRILRKAQKGQSNTPLGAAASAASRFSP